MKSKYLLPAGSGIEWSDFFRLAANNNVGRRMYQPYINATNDAGHAMEDLVRDLLGAVEYVPANRYEFGLTGDEFTMAVNTLAHVVAERRTEGEDYWRFVIGNCRRLMKEGLA